MSLKRVTDVIGAATGLLMLLPVFAVIALSIRFSMGGAILFRQQRPGLGGRPFEMVKFRTMSDRRDANGMLLPDADRLTRIGRFLRATSLDELPELWNVLTGDMSLVGPRPLLIAYIDRYSPDQARRHLVRPGITGWAQVNGRNAISWEEKFILDVWYVDNQTFLLDMRILLMTIVRVFRRDGINSSEAATMPEFLGTSGIDGSRRTDS